MRPTPDVSAQGKARVTKTAWRQSFRSFALSGRGRVMGGPHRPEHSLKVPPAGRHRHTIVPIVWPLVQTCEPQAL
jgi:hypothetical protein